MKELERRHSSLAAQHQSAKEVIVMSVTYNAFLSIYWLGKEEVANRKLLPLIDLEEEVGVLEMKN